MPPPNQARLYQQIETSANFYTPDTYAGGLTWFDSFVTEDDAEAENYIPLTTAGVNPEQSLPFVIGILPPSIAIDTRALDRSATMGSIEGGAQDLTLVEETGSNYVAGSSVVPSPAFWDQFVMTSNRLGVDPKNLAAVLNCESGIDSSREAWATADNLPCPPGTEGGHVVAKGINQLTAQTAKGLGMTKEEYEEYSTWPPEKQLPWVERYMRNIQPPIAGKSAGYIYSYNFSGTGGQQNPRGPNGEVILYATEEYMKEHGGVDKWGAKNYEAMRRGMKNNPNISSNGYFITPDDMGKQIEKRPLSKAQGAAIDAAIARVGKDMGQAAPIIGQRASTAATWKDQGSANAKDAQKNIAKFADTDLNKSELGSQLQGSQADQRSALSAAIDAMSKVPPLKLLVNPTSFKFSVDKIVSDGNWGRNGPIVEHWGNQQEKLEGSGKLAAFYALDIGGKKEGSSGNSPGLNRTARNFSASYQNFLSLYLLYKNNGGVWLTDDYASTLSEIRKNLTVLGSLYIYYDGIFYVGSFDNFSITETDTAPFTLEYSFSFTVRAWFLLDRAADPKRNYGSKPAKATTSTDIPASLSDFDDEVASYGQEVMTDEERESQRTDIEVLTSMNAAPPAEPDPEVLKILKGQGQKPIPTKTQRR